MTNTTTRLDDLGGTTTGAQARLYTLAVDCLRSNEVDVDQALRAFLSHIKNSDVLLSALATDYLNRVAADMRNAARTKHMVAEANDAVGGGTSSQRTIELEVRKAKTKPQIVQLNVHKVEAKPQIVALEIKSSRP